MKRTKQNGITLIALVITIIVLLILAGVSIATLTGQNGILTRANDAKEQTEIADEKEAIQLAYAGAVAEKRGTGDITAPPRTPSPSSSTLPDPSASSAAVHTGEPAGRLPPAALFLFHRLSRHRAARLYPGRQRRRHRPK